MYYHVIENTQRNGVKGYRLVKTYKRVGALMNRLYKTGAPVWVENSRNDSLYVPGGVYGGHVVSYWNTGGWASAVMPRMPFFDK